VTLSCIAAAARFCSSAIRRIQRRPRMRCTRQSPSRSSRRRAVLSYARRSRWRSSITQRPDAHAVLASALNGFSPTPESRDRGSANASRRADVMSESNEPANSIPDARGRLTSGGRSASAWSRMGHERAN